MISNLLSLTRRYSGSYSQYQNWHASHRTRNVISEIPHNNTLFSIQVPRLCCVSPSQPRIIPRYRETISMHLQSRQWSLLLGIISACLFASVESKDLSEHPKETFTFDQLWKLEKGFWDSFLYPANLKQTQGNASTIFASDVSFSSFSLW